MRARGIKKLVREVRVEVIEALRSFASGQKKKGDKISGKWSKGELDYSYAKEKLETTRKTYLDKHEEFENSVGHCLISTSGRKLSTERRAKLSRGLYKLYTKVKEAKNKYMTAYHETKEAREEYIESVRKNLELQRQFEEQLIMKGVELLNLYYSKTIQEGLSMNKQIQELTKKIELEIPKTLEPVKEIKAELKNGNEIVISYEKSNYPKLYEAFDTVNYNKKPIASVDALSIAGEGEVLEEIRPCALLLNNCWYAEEVQPKMIEEFKEFIKTEEGREEFCEAFKVWRARGIPEISKEGYKLVGNLLLLVLDEANKHQDVEPVMKLLILSQTYYTKVGSQKEFLQRYIQKHEIWTKGLWEKTIKKRIEEKKGEVAEEGKGASDEIEHGIYCMLGAIANNMLHFEMNPAEVKELIMRYAELYIHDINLQANLKVLNNVIA